MSRIKGRYVAQIIIDFDFPSEKYCKPAEETIYKLHKNFTNEVAKRLDSDLYPDAETNVAEQYFDLYEVKDDGED